LHINEFQFAFKVNAMALLRLLVKKVVLFAKWLYIKYECVQIRFAL